MSGLFAALALRSRGFDVEVFERVADELAGRGAGIVAQPQIRQALGEIGIAADCKLGVEITHRRMFDATGCLLSQFTCPQTLTSWDHLYRILRTAWPSDQYHRGMTLLRIEQDSDGVTAHFADGSSRLADLLVGADGLRSTVREQFLPDVMPLYAGYVAWRSLIAEAAVSDDTHDDLFDYLSFCLPAGEQALGYPVSGPDNDLRPGHRRYNFVWYRPVDEELRLKDLLTDRAGVTHSISIPPPLVRPDVISSMRDAADRMLAPQFREVVHLSAQPFLQPIYDLAAPRLAFGRVLILGDAAFVARPHVAVGVAKAADDAVALAHALDAHPGPDGNIDAALRHFEHARLGVGHRIIERARHLGAYLQARLRTPEEHGFAKAHHTPEAVIRETAMVDFLYQ